MTWVLPPPDLLPGDDARAPLTAALGMTPDGEPVVLDIAALPHLAIAGTSGSGKSTLIRGMLASLLMVSDPDDLRLILVDVTDELDDLRGVPHLAMDPIDDPETAADVFEVLVEVMDERYAEMRAVGARNVTDYNALGETMPRLLVVVDEFAELMLGDERKRVERAVARIGVRGRKAGIHLVLATQVPHASVLTARIKANLPGRIALTVSSRVHSQVALDEGGAERLKGNGDGLLRDGRSPDLTRFQATWVSPEQLSEIVDYWRDQGEPEPFLVAGDEEEGGERKERHFLQILLTLILLGGIAVFGIHLPSFSLSGGSACPPGSASVSSTLTVTCDRPTGETVCVQFAQGFKPTRGAGTPDQVYVRTVPYLGRWCANASAVPPGG